MTENKQIPKSLQNLVTSIYCVFMCIYMFTEIHKYGNNSEHAKIFTLIATISMVIIIITAAVKTVNNRIHGTVMIIDALGTQLIFLILFREYVDAHVYFALVAVCTCIYEDLWLNRLMMFLTAMIYVISSLFFIGIGAAESTQMYSYVELAYVIIFTEVVLTLIIAKIDKYKKVIRENNRSSQDMLKVVGMKRNEAENATKAKSIFLSNMSHEIRTPINAIIGMNEIALRETKEKNTVEYCERIKQASNILLSLINDILDFSKIESGKMTLLEESYDLKELLSDIYNLFYLRTEEKGLELSMVVDENTPVKLYGDPLRIKQCIINVLTNAIKYTEKGKIDIIVENELQPDNSINLKISVKDTGIGIKSENLGKLFSSFERIDDEKNKTIEGTGLGMSITKNLLKLMKGKITVDSIYGRGSTFVISFPQKVMSNEEIGAFDPRNIAEQLQNIDNRIIKAPNAKILVVDDNEMNLIVFKGILKRSEMNIDIAYSGKECIECVKNVKYDIIFLDHMMPEMDGVETLKSLRYMRGNLCKDTPIIALTANAVTGAKETYLDYGFDDYLAKPIESVRLEKLIFEYLPEGMARFVKENRNEPLEIANNNSIINVEIGMKYVQNVEDYCENLKAFVDFYESKILALTEYIDKKDWKNYEIDVHALKSNSRYIGAMRLGDFAFEHEKAAKNCDTDYIYENIEPLRDEWRKNIGIVNVLLNKYIRITEIIKSIEAFDSDEAERGLNDMIESSLFININSELQGAIDALENFEYGKAKEILTKVAQVL